MEIAENVVYALIGPSGCGKSTFLRTLNRLNDLIPKARLVGKILIEGQDIYDASVDVVQLRKSVGMVFQKPNPLATLKVEELITELKKNYTIVIVTHNMQQSARISDKTGFFLNGTLIETGPTKQFFIKPKKQKTEDYLTGKFG